MKQTPVLVFHAAQNTSSEISDKCLSQGHIDVMPNTGNEPAILRTLALHSNQLSYAAPKQMLLPTYHFPSPFFDVDPGSGSFL